MAGTLSADYIQPQSNTGLTILTPAGGTIASVNIGGIYSATGNLLISSSFNGLVANTGISGLITNDQIASVANTKITGTINVANTNITGNIISTQITSVANTQITGRIIVTQGGTGLTSPGTAGNVLTSSGTAWVSSTPVATSASQLARAWVRFNGTTDPVSIEASYNISSITYVSAGLYTIIFTTAMPSTSYVATGMGEWRNGTSNAGIVTMDRNYPPSTTSLTVSYSGAGGGSSLYYYINVVVFGS